MLQTHTHHARTHTPTPPHTHTNTHIYYRGHLSKALHNCVWLYTIHIIMMHLRVRTKALLKQTATPRKHCITTNRGERNRFLPVLSSHPWWPPTQPPQTETGFNFRSNYPTAPYHRFRKQHCNLLYSKTHRLQVLILILNGTPVKRPFCSNIACR